MDYNFKDDNYYIIPLGLTTCFNNKAIEKYLSCRLHYIQDRYCFQSIIKGFFMYYSNSTCYFWITPETREPNIEIKIESSVDDDTIKKIKREFIKQIKQIMQDSLKIAINLKMSKIIEHYLQYIIEWLTTYKI